MARWRGQRSSIQISAHYTSYKSHIFTSTPSSEVDIYEIRCDPPGTFVWWIHIITQIYYEERGLRGLVTDSLLFLWSDNSHFLHCPLKIESFNIEAKFRQKYLNISITMFVSFKIYLKWSSVSLTVEFTKALQNWSTEWHHLFYSLWMSIIHSFCPWITNFCAGPHTLRKFCSTVLLQTRSCKGLGYGEHNIGKLAALVFGTKG